MSKRKLNISTLAELESEEREVRRRIKQQEVDLSARVKKLPEELVTTAVVRLISTVVKGNTLKSAINFAKRVGKNVFSNVLKDLA
jgi:hypothetical protein